MSASPVDLQVDLNGRLLRAAEARISPLGEGFLYGLGVFETIKVRSGEPVFFPEHAARLRGGAAALGLELRTNAPDLLARCRRLIAANGVGDGSVKLVLFQDEAGAGELIRTGGNPYGPEVYARGFRLRSVGDGLRAGGLDALKTLNYLKNLAARKAAQAAGFDEPIFVAADGAVLEGATTNIFGVRENLVLTPPANGGILPGIVRAKILDQLAAVGAAEGRIDAAWLRAADEVFVTNSLLGVMPVARIDERHFDGNHNPVTRAAMAALRSLERAPAG